MSYLYNFSPTGFLETIKNAPPERRNLEYELALKTLPGSYKLWHAYLTERKQSTRGLPVDAPEVQAVNNTFERALVTMHKMPRIWLDYLSFLVDQKLITRTRRTFDRALASLPITQHPRIWRLYLTFIHQSGIPTETAVRVYRRYLQLEPSHAEEFLAYLRTKERWGDAARVLAHLLDDPSFRSLEGKSKHQLWLELCDLVTRHPESVRGVPVEEILRGGIRRYRDDVGRLWTALAEYFMRRRMFERARDVYEEALTSVTTVRDFSTIFDSFTQMEEGYLTLLLAQADTKNDEENGSVKENDDVKEKDKGGKEKEDTDDEGDDFLLKDDGDDVDLRLARLDHLMARRPELLSSVALRQNPHNVIEWLKRAKLFRSNPTKQILCFAEAVRTVDPEKATGKPGALWVAFAKLYERHGDLANARIVFEKAFKAKFKYTDDLAVIWCEAAEFELRNKEYRKALTLMRRAVTLPPEAAAAQDRRGGGGISKRDYAAEKELPPQQKLYRNTRLYTLLVDLEESLGTVESTGAAYERMLDLKIATPQTVLNYASFLQEHKHFDESFRVYERGVAAFRFPHAADIWRAYLAQFVERFKGSKLERARDLFEQAVAAAPPEHCRTLYLSYATLEESYGLARRAMEIYERATRTVPIGERLAVYDIYLSRATELYGVSKVREVFETAIEAEPPHGLSDADCRTLCLRFAAFEQRLGEVDRARAIFRHAAPLADPKEDKSFWDAWKQFEAAHGNEDTFKELLRMQRTFYM